MNRFFSKYDLLVTPTLPILPFPIGQLTPQKNKSDWFEWAGNCYPFNLTQQPAASVYSGTSNNGLPIGLQVVGRKYEDYKVLMVCAFLESVFGTPNFPNLSNKTK